MKILYNAYIHTRNLYYNMQWNTSISNIQNGKELIRGYNLKNLIEQKSFVETIWLILKGELPTDKQKRMLDALFTAAIDHGIGVSSAMTARTVVSTGNSLHTALAAGILALGQLHGSAVEDAAKFFQENKNISDVPALIQEMHHAKIKIPGYGHKILNNDPRSESLFKIAKGTGYYGIHCEFAIKVHTALNAVSSKILPINVDGAMGAIISDLGFDWKIAKGFFIIGRVPGLVAHTYEEMISGNGLRRLTENETTYQGPLERPLP